MPISERTSIITDQAIRTLTRRGWRIREHPDYPDTFWPASALRRGFRRLIFSGRRADGFEVVKKPNGSARNHRSVVIRKPSVETVFQVSEGHTRQSTSVLGRTGVISIIRQRLEAILRVEVSTAELARYLSDGRYGVMVQSVDKLLRRLDQGCFVTEEQVAAYFDKLGICLEELVFSHPLPPKTRHLDPKRVREERNPRRDRRQVAYRRTAERYPRKLAAHCWAGSEPALYTFLRREKAACRIQSCGLDGLAKGVPLPSILEILSEIGIVLDCSRRLSRNDAIAKLEEISAKLSASRLNAWFAHIP